MLRCADEEFVLPAAPLEDTSSVSPSSCLFSCEPFNKLESSTTYGFAALSAPMKAVGSSSCSSRPFVPIRVLSPFSDAGLS